MPQPEGSFQRGGRALVTVPGIEPGSTGYLEALILRAPSIVSAGAIGSYTALFLSTEGVLTWRIDCQMPCPLSAGSSSMAPCGECGRNTPFAVGDVHLCLRCYSLLMLALRMRENILQEQANYPADQIHAVTGLNAVTPRSPVEKLPPVIHHGGDLVFHNVKVDRGVVGAINADEVARIAVAMSQIAAGGNELRRAIEDLTEAIVNSQELQVTAKNELLEQLAALTEQAAALKHRRRPGVFKALMASVTAAVSGVEGLARPWYKAMSWFDLAFREGGATGTSTPVVV